MAAFNGKAPYAPDYASYNWIGAPSNFELATNKNLGGDSRMSLDQSSWQRLFSDAETY